MLHTFYTFEFDGQRFDLECDTAQEAMSHADEWWAQHCDSEYDGKRNGEIFKGECFIIGFDDDGDVSRERYKLEYEHYRGDYAEHNIFWGLR